MQIVSLLIPRINLVVVRSIWVCFCFPYVLLFLLQTKSADQVSAIWATPKAEFELHYRRHSCQYATKVVNWGSVIAPSTIFVFLFHAYAENDDVQSRLRLRLLNMIDIETPLFDPFNSSCELDTYFVLLLTLLTSEWVQNQILAFSMDINTSKR